jgi:pimeloyl-ACP methyl ester carboxylesterase
MRRCGFDLALPGLFGCGLHLKSPESDPGGHATCRILRSGDTAGGERAMRPEPFTVAIPAADLDDLRRRLEATRWADDFGNADWAYGVERGWLEGMVDYWGGGFDWRAQEAAINALPQFRVEIDGLLVHYVHVRARTADPIPLLLTHGWPWTFWDYRKMLLPLAEAGFDVVVPSIPGSGFSPLARTGVVIAGIAERWVALMRDVLGYDRFAAAGGDWGASITAELGHAHAQHLLGAYLSTCTWPGLNLFNLDPALFADDEQWMIARLKAVGGFGLGSAMIQRIGTQTLAYALVDSPVGTAAWLWERRRAWSEADGDVLGVFDRDFLCTTASIYWLTRTIGTSIRLYRDHYSHGWTPRDDSLPIVKAPTGFGVYPKDVVFAPRALAERATNLVRWTVMPRGGHFGPSEQPKAAVEELTTFFHTLRDAR